MIRVDSAGLRELRDVLADMQVNVKKEMRIAAWKAQKKARKEIARRLTTIIKQPVKRFKKATYSKMTDDGFIVAIRTRFKIGLRHFKPKQNNKGVIAKTGRATVYIDGRTGRKRKAGGDQFFPSGFMGPRPGVISGKLRGTPVQRITSKRLPIQALPAVHVASTVIASIGFTDKIARQLKLDYIVQVRERIRFLKLKLANKLRNQKK